MIFYIKSYSDRRNRGRNGCQSFLVKVIFLLASRLLASTTLIYLCVVVILLLRHDALYGADVRPGSSLQRGECSPVRVECDVLGNSGRTNPLFHRNLRPTAHQSLEYQTFLFRIIANQPQSFFTDGNDVFRLVLLRNDVYAFPPAE